MAIPSAPVATWRSMDEAAKLLKLSRRTLTRWVSQGDIRVYRIPGDRHRFVDLDEIKRFREPKAIERRLPE